MSIDDIRQQKSMALLEYLESEDKVYELKGRLQILSGTILRFGKELDPGDKVARSINPNTLQSAEFAAALNQEAAIQLAQEYLSALAELDELSRKKKEFGLR